MNDANDFHPFKLLAQEDGSIMLEVHDSPIYPGGFSCRIDEYIARIFEGEISHFKQIIGAILGFNAHPDSLSDIEGL